VEFKIVKYLEVPPTFQQLEAILKKLDINPIELIRKKENYGLKNLKIRGLRPTNL